MVDECANLGIMAPGGKAVSRLACQVALSQAMNDANEAIELLQTTGVDVAEVEALSVSVNIEEEERHEDVVAPRPKPPPLPKPPTLAAIASDNAGEEARPSPPHLQVPAPGDARDEIEVVPAPADAV